jgi:hypothetical protein
LRSVASSPVNPATHSASRLPTACVACVRTRGGCGHRINASSARVTATVLVLCCTLYRISCAAACQRQRENVHSIANNGCVVSLSPSLLPVCVAGSAIKGADDGRHGRRSRGSRDAAHAATGGHACSDAPWLTVFCWVAVVLGVNGVTRSIQCRQRCWLGTAASASASVRVSSQKGALLFPAP